MGGSGGGELRRNQEEKEDEGLSGGGKVAVANEGVVQHGQIERTYHYNVPRDFIILVSRNDSHVQVVCYFGKSRYVTKGINGRGKNSATTYLTAD